MVETPLFTVSVCIVLTLCDVIFAGIVSVPIVLVDDRIVSVPTVLVGDADVSVPTVLVGDANVSVPTVCVGGEIEPPDVTLRFCTVSVPTLCIAFISGFVPEFVVRFDMVEIPILFTGDFFSGGGVDVLDDFIVGR